MEQLREAKLIHVTRNVQFAVNPDRANFYHVPQEVCTKLDVKEAWLWIYPDDAVKGGISVAVVMNFMRGITEGRQGEGAA